MLRKDLLTTFFLIAVVPFCAFVHLAPLGDFWPFFLACSAVTVCAVVGLGISNFKQNSLLVSPFVGWLVAFFLLLCLLTFIQNVNTSDRFTLLIYSVVVILAALLAVQLAHKGEAQYYDYLALVLVFGGVVQGLSAIAIQYRLMGIDYWMIPVSNRFIGFIAQSNQLAIYMMVAFLALSYLVFRRKMPVIIAVVIASFFGFVLLGSGSRATLIYLVLSIVVTIFCWLKSKDKTYLRFSFLIGALIVGAIVYYYLPVIISWFTDEMIQGVVSDASKSYNRSSSSDAFRLSEITKALALFKEAPLFGIGFGNYAAQGFWFGVQDEGYTFLGDLTLHSHNFLVQILVEFGLVGFVALLAILCYMLVRFWRIAKTPQWWLVFTICGVYFINSLLEYVLWRMQFVPLFVLVIVPLLSPVITLRFSRLISPVIWVLVAGIFVVLASGSLTTYSKSFFYNQETTSLDQADYQTYLSANHDLVWGREIQQQAFSSLSPNIVDFSGQLRATDAMLAWRPYAPVIVNKIQLLLLSGQVGELEKLSRALLKAYPKMVPGICDYFNNFNHIENRQGLRIVKKTLNCRAVLVNSKG